MELEFKEPTLELYFLLKAAGSGDDGDKARLREYLVRTMNINTYCHCLENGLLEACDGDLKREDSSKSETKGKKKRGKSVEALNEPMGKSCEPESSSVHGLGNNLKICDANVIAMKTKITEILDSLEKEKEEDAENESHMICVEKRVCEFYAKIGDFEKFTSLSKELVSKEPCISLQLDILMCKIRISIIQEKRSSLVNFVEQAKFIFESSSDWDRKNRFKVYLGLFHLIKAEFPEAAACFTEAISSFDATELVSFERLVLYTTFTSLLSFNREDLKEKIIENPEIRKCCGKSNGESRRMADGNDVIDYGSILELPVAFFECHYSEMLRKLVNFIRIVETDLFLEPFKEHFCKEMKIKMYFQLLMSYQSLHLNKMGHFFNVESKHIEEDLRNFITEGRIPCAIDRIDGVVRMKNFKKEDDLQAFFSLGAEVMRDIKKSID